METFQRIYYSDITEVIVAGKSFILIQESQKVVTESPFVISLQIDRTA